MSSNSPSTTPAAKAADVADERLIASRGIGGALSTFVDKLKTGDLGSLPVVIGLLVIWAVFQSQNDAFLSPDNLVNLALQSAAVGTISIGVVLVLLLGEIDLSIGSVSGLSAAVLAVGMVNNGWSVGVSITLAILTGTSIGLLYGALYTRFGVPSFVITLAGLLAILGLQLKVLGKDGTINLPYDSAVVQFAQRSFLPDGFAYALCAVVVAFFVGARILDGRRRRAAGLTPPSMPGIAIKGGALAAVLVTVVYVLGQDRGVPWMFVTFLVFVVVMDLALRKTKWGRAVMAVGGNVEAARRSGIKVRAIYMSVFALCSTFAAVGGLFAAARLASANQSSGTGDTNLNAIAAAVIGGTSLFGGRGSAYSALLGILVIQSISNGLNLLSLDSSIRFMVTGAVLLIAVIIDSLSRRSRSAAGKG